MHKEQNSKGTERDEGDEPFQEMFLLQETTTVHKCTFVSYLLFNKCYILNTLGIKMYRAL
jgi:hypothetical protein